MLRIAEMVPIHRGAVKGCYFFGIVLNCKYVTKKVKN